MKLPIASNILSPVRGLLIVMAVTLFLSQSVRVGQAGILDDAANLKLANATLWKGNYKKALEEYARVSIEDGALYREAYLGRCLCLAMLGFTVAAPEEGIKHFSDLIELTGAPVDLSPLGDGSIFVNSRFWADLIAIFGKTGHFGAGEISQGMILTDDSNYSAFSRQIELLGTDAQKQFSGFFKVSLDLSGATCELCRNAFEACLTQAQRIHSPPPVHVS